MTQPSRPFDPYHRWLAIMPQDQPPTYYQLLGVHPSESDPEVIRDAAEARMAHVRTYQLGKYCELSQEILCELGTAKACLLDAEKKAAYDRQLSARQREPGGAGQIPRGPMQPPLAAPHHDGAKSVAANVPPPAFSLAPAAGSTFDEVIENSNEVQPLPPQRKRRLPSSWFLRKHGRLAILAAIATLVFLAVILLPTTTGHGTVKFDLPDSAAEAHLTLDGHAVDIATLKQSQTLQVGKHELKVQLDKYEPLALTFTVRQGENEPIRVAMKLKARVSEDSKSNPAEPKGNQDKVAVAQNKEVDLFKLIDPANDPIRGTWSFQNGGLECETNGCIEIPYSPPEEYDYRVVIFVLRDDQCFQMICRGGATQFGFIVGMDHNTVAGLQLIRGQRANQNATKFTFGEWLVAGHRYVAVVKVRKTLVEAWLDDRLIAKYGTDWTDLSVPPRVVLRRSNTIGLAAFADVRVESATVVEISGSGATLRPPVAAAP
jgi:hypothetical protein